MLTALLLALVLCAIPFEAWAIMNFVRPTEQFSAQVIKASPAVVNAQTGDPVDVKVTGESRAQTNASHGHEETQLIKESLAPDVK